MDNLVVSGFDTATRGRQCEPSHHYTVVRILARSADKLRMERVSSRATSVLRRRRYGSRRRSNAEKDAGAFETRGLRRTVVGSESSMFYKLFRIEMMKSRPRSISEETQNAL